MSEQMRIESQSPTGRWVEVDADEAERLIDLAATMTQKRGGQWAPVTREELLRGLSRTAEPRFGTDWCDHIRRVREFSPEQAHMAGDLEKRVEQDDRRLAALDD